MIEAIFNTTFLFTILRVATPLMLASMGALIVRKAGIMVIAFEGIMLVAALFGVLGSYYFKNPYIGLLTGILGGLIITGLFAYFVLVLDANNVLTGLALNIFASGGTIFLLYLLTGDKGSSRGLGAKSLPAIHIPIIKDIPIIGDILSGQHLLTYVAILSVIFTYIFIYKTPLGLRIRSVGENEHAAESLGINSTKIKVQALLIGGIIASLGGVYMSMGYLPFFTRDMVSGRGFMAIAAQNLGGGHPLFTLISVLFFGFTEALSNTLQSLNMPSEILQALPYAATIFGLLFVGINKNRVEKKGLNL